MCSLHDQNTNSQELLILVFYFSDRKRIFEKRIFFANNFQAVHIFLSPPITKQFFHNCFSFPSLFDQVMIAMRKIYSFDIKENFWLLKHNKKKVPTRKTFLKKTFWPWEKKLFSQIFKLKAKSGIIFFKFKNLKVERSNIILSINIDKG